MRTSFWGLCISTGLCFACSGTAHSGFGGGSGNSSGSGGGGFGGSTSGGGTGGGAPNLSGDAGEGGTGSGPCVVTNPNDDMDKDGWTPNQGDCNDCDPNVNPGAVDTWHQPADGGPGFWGNEDCSGSPGDNAMPCDTGLALDDVVAGDGAKAIELCA